MKPFALLAVALAPLAAAVPHPLDPLSADEITRAVSILREAGHVDATTLYPEFDLAEPSKEALLRGEAIPRRALVVAMDRPNGVAHEAIVDLSAGKIVSREPIRSGQPMMLMGEYDAAGNAVRESKEWQAAMARRGITDPAAVYLDTWAPGEVEREGPVPRLARVLSFHRGTQQNPYGPPVEGVVAMVDLSTMQVVEVRDTGVRPMSTQSTDYYDPKVTGTRPALAPLVTSLPEGAGFIIDGHELRWDRWRLRFSMRPREGLVLHDVRWLDGNRQRRVLHRASLSEMVVPYADPSDDWSWRSAFDEGEYGLGRLSTPLTRGVNTPAHATLIDATFASDAGEPEPLEGAVAVFERDAGLLWFHHDAVHGSAARRARELVLQTITTIGNYDYCAQWVFKQDGAIDFELVLSGSLLTKGTVEERCTTCAPGRDGLPSGDQRHGTLVAPRVVAPHHQHFVSVRLDLDVDGADNAVKEINVRGERSRRHPKANAFVAVPTLLASELDARRHVSPAESRTWEIVNPASLNAQGHPAAYAIVPGAASLPHPGPRSTLRRRGVFAMNAFHATRYRDGELFAAGSYPNQNPQAEGLARWVADDESLAGDVVAWYTVGVTHVPRPEEYPIMGATKVGFHLVPVGFFDRNPGLDVPPQRAP